jgi:Predicted ATPase (AAA+ superfamily)
MNSLKQLLKPRPSIFDKSKRDTVLDLTDLMRKDKINAKTFFEENFITDGMNALYEGVIKRFEGKSDDGIFRLKQTLGGGKTHNMIAIGLLALHPELRNQVMGQFYKTSFNKPVKVVAFSGYETPQYGIWGFIAESLGKKEFFKNYYEPLTAPGQTAWKELMKDEHLLILMDELPLYLEGAKARQIGNSDLASQTALAITNLMVAIGNEELKNVCLIMSDLTANWQAGMEMIQDVLRNVDAQTKRSARDFTPVQPNSDEIYYILRKRLFENDASPADIRTIALAYGEALKEAKLVGMTSDSPESFAANIENSFPFHPGTKDLFARFKENPGFQQTRGMIRLMRTFLSRMFSDKDGWADSAFLIHPFDFDLNDSDTLTEVQNINRELVAAISHDIANHGSSVAEKLDSKFGNSLCSDTAKLLLLSSLSSIHGGLKGLNENEIVKNIIKPARIPSNIKNEVIIPLTTEAWYLHPDRSGNLLFKDVKNVVAQLNEYSGNYNEETVKKDLINYLKLLFEPKRKDCYQTLYVLPSLDEVELSVDKVSLVIYTPHSTSGLNPQLEQFYTDQTFKNRVMFLSGDNRTLATVNENAARWKAINQILADLEQQGVQKNSTEYIEAERLQESIQFNLQSALQQTFVKLYYPHSNGLKADTLTGQFTDSNYDGEEQIKNVLTKSYKFTTDVTSDVFRQQCEVKLFVQKQMPWNEIKKNSAINIKWPWHKPDALDQLKDDMIFKGQWRSDGSNWVEKGPFPPPSTEVRIQRIARDEETGEVTLKITAVNGDVVHYEIGGTATTASSKIEDFKEFKTSALIVSFICEDSSGKHNLGKAETWKNEVTLKYKVYDQGNNKMVEIKSAPNADIKYTSDGSNPLNGGTGYNAPFKVQNGTRFILAVAEKDGIISNQVRIDIPVGAASAPTIDKDKPLKWKRKQSFRTTQDTYDFFEKAKKYEAQLYLSGVYVQGTNWLELLLDDSLLVNPTLLEDVISKLRENLFGEGQISAEVVAMHFTSGQKFEDYLHEIKTELKPNEIEQ